MYIVRISCTALVLGLWSLCNFLLSVPATIATGAAAGRQFDNSVEGYVVSSAVSGMFHGFGLVISVVFGLILVATWWGPAKRLIAAITAALLVLLAPALPVRAYYDKTDYAEAYFILPNESAFFVPDVAANKDSQASFGSEEFLKANKVPAKRFQIPHAKFSGSGSLFSDYYVPTGRLIIVDRTPYSREWVASSNRGSSSKDEAFHCQTKEGMNITVGVTIGASVTEENVAKYLYRFSVDKPAGNRQDPQVIFTSVFYGRSLQQVMDGPIRNKVQSLVCNEFMGRTLDEGNAQARQVIAAVEKSATEYLASVGITLDYVGYADTLTFDHDVQEIINRKYIADQEAAIAGKMGPHVATLQGLAEAEAVRTRATKWDGKLPATMSLWWFPAGVGEWFTGTFGGKKGAQ